MGIRTTSVAAAFIASHFEQRHTDIGKIYVVDHFPIDFITKFLCLSIIQCEPTLLPEPNHVMLNHLYALSIKDGVMVLSATHRYRKKYVTTLLYKPI